VIAGRHRPRQFEPVQRRLAGHRRAVRPLRLELAGQDRHQGIVAQLVMIVEILVAERQREHPLADKRCHAVLDQLRPAPVLKARGEPLDEPDRPICRAEQQRAGIRRDGTAVERRHDRATLNACEFQRFRATLRRHRGRPSLCNRGKRPGIGSGFPNQVGSDSFWEWQHLPISKASRMPS
jgi:hypothetical protein